MASTGSKPLYQHLYFQVVWAILIGILLGHFYPTLAVKMQPLGEAFIKTIKMLIAPIIFCTVVHGIASMNDMKKVGRVGLKAIIYFEVVTTLALIVGLVIVNLWQPGAGMNVDPSAIDAKSIQSYATQRSRKTRSTICCTSFRRLSSAPSPRARSSRYCSSPFCSLSLSTWQVIAASRFCR